METEIPYMLYLKFMEPAESTALRVALDALGLQCLGEEMIDGEFSIVHYHFQNDPSKKTVLHIEVENNSSERINISMYNGTDLETVKELFSFFENFEAGKIKLIDQEIKNELYLKDMNTFASTAESTDISEDWINNTEKQATLSLNFEDFYNNGFKIARREQLLGKVGVR